MRLSPSTLERLRHASWPIVALVVVGVLAGILLRTSRRGHPLLGLIVVGFLVLNGGLVVLSTLAASR